MSAFKGEAAATALGAKNRSLAHSQSCPQQIAEIFDILIGELRLHACALLPSFCFRRFLMALFKLPLSGDVVQWINPVTWFASGNQISTNVYLGESSSPETEAEILDRSAPMESSSAKSLMPSSCC